MLPIEHNRTLGNIEHNRTLHATIEHKTSFMRCVQISYVLGFNFIHEYAKMSQDGKREKFWKRGIKATMTARFRRQCR